MNQPKFELNMRIQFPAQTAKTIKRGPRIPGLPVSLRWRCKLNDNYHVPGKLLQC